MDYCRCDIKNRMIEHVARMTDVTTGKGGLVGKHKTKRTTPRWKDNIKPLKPTGYYVYHQFHIHNSTFCPHSCIYVFCVDLRKNSDYFPIQH